ncbi:CatB-related O-acetyltransferase [Methylobacterium phyllosphaerae]
MHGVVGLLRLLFCGFSAKTSTGRGSPGSPHLDPDLGSHIDLLRLLGSRTDPPRPEDAAILSQIYRRMLSSQDGSMPLVRPLSSKLRQETFLRGQNIDIMTNSSVSPDCDIGDYTYIGYNTYITRAKIGRYCSIGNNVSIGQGEHHTHLVSTSVYFMEDPYNSLTTGDCEIGNDVWIAVDAVVRRGVKIGNGAVIGANSFVNSDVPPYSIYAGSPARFIKYRFDDRAIQTIEASRWWEMDLDEAKSAMPTLVQKCGLG